MAQRKVLAEGCYVQGGALGLVAAWGGVGQEHVAFAAHIQLGPALQQGLRGSSVAMPHCQMEGSKAQCCGSIHISAGQAAIKIRGNSATGRVHAVMHAVRGAGSTA